MQNKKLCAVILAGTFLATASTVHARQGFATTRAAAAASRAASAPKAAISSGSRASSGGASATGTYSVTYISSSGRGASSGTFGDFLVTPNALPPALPGSEGRKGEYATAPATTGTNANTQSSSSGDLTGLKPLATQCTAFMPTINPNCKICNDGASGKSSFQGC